MSKGENKSNIIDLTKEQDKREVFRRSKNSRRDNFTLIDNNCLQSPNLSLAAIGLLAYLISLPLDWIVYTTQLSARFNLGRDSVRKIIRELIKNGYMRRYQERSENGRLGRWVTEFSDTPDFINHLPETENPAPVEPGPILPAPVKSALQNTNNTNKIPNKKTTQQKSDIKPESNEPVVVDSEIDDLIKKARKWGVCRTSIKDWVKQHGLQHVREKINLPEVANAKSPARYLNAAINKGYLPEVPKKREGSQNPPIERVYPSHEENVAWYNSLSENEKLAASSEASSKPREYFEEYLKQNNVSVLDFDFTEHFLFKRMMELIGRAK